jgi:hypothetical protein
LEGFNTPKPDVRPIKMSKTGNFISFIVMFLGVIALVCFDEHAVRQIWHQHESASFPTTTGRVYHSAVSVTHSSKGGTHYYINILYDYEVDGQSFHGGTFRYGMFSPGSAQAYAAVRAHPVGSEIKVYYNPGDPADSLLSPGVVGHDFFVLFIIFPASAVLLLVLFKADGPGWFTWRSPVAGGVKIVSQGGQVRVTLPRYTVAAWTVSTFCIASGAALLTLAITTQRDPSTQPEGIGGIAVLAVTAGIFLWRRARQLSGVDDLVINDDARTIVLPQTFGRRHPKTLDFSAVRSVRLESIRHRSKNGYYYTWAVALELQDNAAESERLSHWSSQTRSDALAQWLRERLHLTAPVAQVEDFNNAFSLSSSVG